jgi:GTP-binding protein
LVGKRGLAYTSSKPGCTQLINFFRVEAPGGEPMHLVDLPGYGYARVPLDVKSRWKLLIESYLLKREALQKVVVLLDARRGWMEQDLELKEWLEFHRKQYVVVATKVDKLNQKEEYRGLAGIRQSMDGGELLPFSAVTGRGVREIWQAIRTKK